MPHTLLRETPHAAMRFETRRHARSWLSLTVAAAAAVCLADFDVAVVVEGGALQHWTVSADGATWTQGANILGSTSVCQMAARVRFS